MANKYVTTEVSGIITQIAKPTEEEGYTEGIFEVYLPDEEKMTNKEVNQWISENNKRMKAICEFLNDNKL